MKAQRTLARTLRWLIPLSMSLAAGAVAHADNALDDAFTPRALGMGESLRGAATGSAAPMNPAGLALLHNYAVEGSYGYSPAANATVLSTSVADSTTRVGMALYYNLLSSSNDIGIMEPGTGVVHPGTEELKRHEFGASTSFPISDRFVLGLTPKYTSYDIQLNDPMQTKETSIGSHSRFNLDVGALVGLTPTLTLGLVGYNLLHHDVEYPRAVGGGLAFGLSNAALLAADAVVDTTSKSDAGKKGQSVRASGGTELVLAGLYPVRAGVIYDSRAGQTFVTGGLGYLSPRVGIDLAVRQEVKGGSETVGIIGLKFFLPESQTQTSPE